MTSSRKVYEKPAVQKVTLAQQEVSLYYTCKGTSESGGPAHEDPIFQCECPTSGPCYENWPG